MHTRSNHRSGGFTLIELCIVMIIVGLALAVFLQFASTFTEKKRLEALADDKGDIQKALVDFIVDDPLVEDRRADGSIIPKTGPGAMDSVATRGDYEGQRFPCPADPALAPGDPGFGQEVVATSGGLADPSNPDSNVTGCAVTGGVQVAGTGANAVYIGALPTATLGLQYGNAADVYGNKYTYAVSANLTGWSAAVNLDTPGNVAMVHSDGSLSHRAQFAVISHGPDGKGAYPLAGTARTACTGTGLDLINCNDDGRFLIAGVQEASGADYYDDYAFSTFGDDINDGWMQSVDTAQVDIQTKNAGNVGIGKNPGASYKLDVAGNINSDGDVYVDGMTGLGTITPAAKLDVAGEVRIGNTGLACDSATTGATRYNAADDRMEYCSNTNVWKPYGKIEECTEAILRPGGIEITKGERSAVEQIGTPAGFMSGTQGIRCTGDWQRTGCSLSTNEKDNDFFLWENSCLVDEDEWNNMGNYKWQGLGIICCR